MVENMARKNTTLRSTSTGKINATIYLGYHKTASKWIWQNLFTEYYSSRQVDLYKQSVDEIYDQLSPTSGPLVLRQRVEAGSLGAELPQLLQVIKEKFPEAKIVVGIRSQKSMLASHYGQYVANGGRLGFSNYVRQTVKTKWHYCDFLTPFWGEYGDRLLVYLFEDLRADSFRLLCRLRNFVGDPPNGLSDEKIRQISEIPPLNPQRHDLTVDTMLLLNRLRMRHQKNAIIPELRRPGHDHILVETDEYISRKYRHYRGHPLRYKRFPDHGILKKNYGLENQRLSKLLGRPLSKFGYPT